MTNKEQSPYIYVSKCFIQKNFKDAVCSSKKDIVALQMDAILVITLIFMMECFPYNHSNAFDTTATNTNYKVYSITICPFWL